MFYNSLRSLWLYSTLYAVTQGVVLFTTALCFDFSNESAFLTAAIATCVVAGISVSRSRDVSAGQDRISLCFTALAGGMMLWAACEVDNANYRIAVMFLAVLVTVISAGAIATPDAPGRTSCRRFIVALPLGVGAIFGLPFVLERR